MHLALINRTEALEKKEKHKSDVKSNKREEQALCSFAQFREEEQEPLSDDAMTDPPAKKQRSNINFKEDLAVFFCQRRRRV